MVEKYSSHSRCLKSRFHGVWVPLARGRRIVWRVFAFAHLGYGFDFQTASSFKTRLRDLAADAREFFRERPALLKIRGRRECRAPAAPAASRAKINKAHEHSHHGHTGITRHSLRNGFNGLFRALPGDRALLPPSPADIRKLDASVGASGPHDFAVRSRRRSSAALPRPPHPAPRP